MSRPCDSAQAMLEGCAGPVLLSSPFWQAALLQPGLPSQSLTMHPVNAEECLVAVRETKSDPPRLRVPSNALQADKFDVLSISRVQKLTRHLTPILRGFWCWNILLQPSMSRKCLCITLSPCLMAYQYPQIPRVDSPFDSLSLQKSVLVHGRSNPPHPPDTVAIVKLHYLPESACQGDLDTTDLSSSRTTRVSEEKLFLHDAQQEGSCPISRGIAHLFQRRAGRSRRPVTPGFLRVSGHPSGPS